MPLIKLKIMWDLLGLGGGGGWEFSIVCFFLFFGGGGRGGRGRELPLRHHPYMKPVVIPHSTKAVHIIRSFSIIIIEVCGKQEALWQETLADNPVIER